MSSTGWECGLWNVQRVSEIFVKDFHAFGYCHYCWPTLYLRSHSDVFLHCCHFGSSGRSFHKTILVLLPNNDML